MTDDRRLPRCERTARLIDRVVDDRVTDADREHASTCLSCGPVLLKSAKFDGELSRVARGLVAERMPNGVLDDDLAPAFAGRIPPMRHVAPGLASVLAAVVVLLVATSVALAPGGLGGGTPPPTTGLGMSAPAFRPTVDLIAVLRDELGYFCSAGHALPTSGPSARPGEREGVRCLSPKSIENAIANVIPVETGDGLTVEITVEGQLYGTDTVKSKNELAATLSMLTSLSLADPQAAHDAAAFVENALPGLVVAASGDHAVQVFGNIKVLIQRSIAGYYRLTLTPV